MPAPHKFTRKLHAAIGEEAAEAMVDWMNRTDEKLDELHQELAEFRQTVRADFAELRQEMNVKFAEVREEMRVGFARIDAKFDTRLANMDAKLDAKFAEFMKWTLGFWVVSLVTYVGALLALAKFLR